MRFAKGLSVLLPPLESLAGAASAMVVRFVWGVDGGTFGVDVGGVVGGRGAKG